MGWEAWLVAAVVVVLIVALAKEIAEADILCVSLLTVLLVAGEVSGSKLLPKLRDAVSDFGNPGLITVGVLFVVVTGLIQTGAMSLVTGPLLGRPKTTFSAQLRVLLPVATFSAFLNNTPIVAMFMPVCDDLCKKANISPSKLFMPMAYAATLGGCCTMIGTSTNLVVNAALIQSGRPGFQMWDISWIGIPCAIVGIAYFLLLGRWLLPDRRPAINLSDDPRQYMVEMSVEPGGPLVNKTIEEAGLRHLPGLYLAEIDRDGEILPAVGPRERLQANDRLVFVGVVESVVDLRKMRGLRPAHDQLMKLNSPVTSRSLIEAVVSNRCPIVNKSIREGQFRSRYQAAVLAVARSGHRLTGKIGDIVLQPGDTLLLEAHADFAKQQRNSNDFFLVSSVDNASLPRHEQAWTALAVLVAMIGVVTALDWDMLTAALVAAIAMIVTRCCTSEEARRSIDWSVLITIGAASGIARSLETTGLAKFVTEQLITLAGEHPWTQLIVVYALTMVLTELITNNAAAQLMFPLAMSTVDQLGVSHVPFVVAIMVAASMGFATPFGYQTNLMVYGPGGYKFSDYLRVGVPLDLLMMLITILLTPWLYPF